MIGTSFWEYVFIRACVFILHKFVPLLLLCLVLTLVLDHDAHSLILFLEAISIAEVAFYVLVYIPKYRLLQRPARHPPVTNREDRRRIFLKGQESIVDPEQYLFKWFNEASISDIRRENVKEFYCWAFLNRRVWGLADEEELDEYVDKTEELLGRKLPPGRGPVTALRLTIDPVNMLHRPLLWYMVGHKLRLAIESDQTIDCLDRRYIHLPLHDILWFSVLPPETFPLSYCLPISFRYTVQFPSFELFHHILLVSTAYIKDSQADSLHPRNRHRTVSLCQLP